MPLISRSSAIRRQAGCCFTGRAVRSIFERVAQEAAKRSVCFEINASPERLHFYSPLLRIAKAKRGAVHYFHRCLTTLNISVNMRWGVVMVRRWWLSPAHILNTQPVEIFLNALRKRYKTMTKLGLLPRLLLVFMHSAVIRGTEDPD